MMKLCFILYRHAKLAMKRLFEILIGQNIDITAIIFTVSSKYQFAEFLRNVGQSTIGQFLDGQRCGSNDTMITYSLAFVLD